MPEARTIVFLAAILLAVAPLARAQADGLADGLPPAPSPQGCPSLDEVATAHAADAVRAAFLPLRPLSREEIFGVTLLDDPRALEIVRRTLGEKPPPGWSSASRCTNSICALQAALNGSLPGALTLLEIGSHGVVASLDQSPWSDGKVSIWRDNELRMIAAALRDLPAGLLAKATNFRAFRRVPDGDDLAGHANALSERGEARLGGGGSINLRDTVWKMDPESRREIIAHELGHHLDYAAERSQHRKYALSHGAEWLAIGGWSTSGSLNVPNGFHRTPTGEEAWTAGSWPSEEFANSIAEYRYQGRLLRDYSPRAFAYAGHYFDGDYIKAAPDAVLDNLIGQAGGRVALFLGCAAMVQQTALKPDGGPAHLALLHKRADGRSETANWDRFSLVAKSPCVAIALEELKKLPQWNSAVCRREPEENWVRIAERLQEVEAGVYEGVQAIEAAHPPGDPQRMEIARDRARRVFAEFSPGINGAEAESETESLARAILKESP